MQPISIIIITLNEAERIQNLLSDLAQQSYQNFEVIVVDSDSDDETRELANTFADSFPKLTVHHMAARGVSLGRNTGAKLANHERLLFLDADVRLPATFLEQSMQQLKNRGLAVAGVYMQATDLPVQYKLGYSLFNVGLYLTQFGFPTAVGACIFSSKVVHEALGGFDRRLTLCEDCDYVNRASQICRFRMLPIRFSFDARRLQQDGFMSTSLKYLHANARRFFFGELLNNEIEYKFGHYTSQEKANHLSP